MESLAYLADGFAAAISFQNLLFALAGVILGMFIGALPGFGPSAGIAILLPLVFVIPPTGGLIMMGAIYYGNMYGNTLSSVLLNTGGHGSPSRAIPAAPRTRSLRGPRSRSSRR